MQRAFLLGLLAALAAGAVLFITKRPGESAAEDTRPNVLVITIDTLRADAVGPGRHTPALNAFIEGATHFQGARTVTPLTLPAHLSLFTGLLPARHGVHANVSEGLTKDRRFSLLAEEFKQAGYTTAAFVAAPVVGRSTGIQAGFDVFEGPDFATEVGGGYITVSAYQQRAAFEAWFERLPAGRPFFAWVHFYDAHDPYDAFSGDALRPATTSDDSDRVRYAGEVRRVDAVVETLLAAIAPETLIVIASDHGEGLGDHGESTHGALVYGTTIDALLVMRAPGLNPGPARGPRSLCDVAPTLRALCGLDEAQTDGSSLLGAPRGVVVSEALTTWFTQGWAQCFSATDGRYTLIASGPRLEIFDRETDPGEQRPLEAMGHEAYERLDQALQEMRKLAKPKEEWIVEHTSPYSSGRRPSTAYFSPAVNAKLKDPVVHVAFWEEMEEMRHVLQRASVRGQADTLLEVMVKLKKLSAQDPHNPAPWFYLAQAQSALAGLRQNPHWHGEAAASATQSIERGYRLSAPLRMVLQGALASGRRETVASALGLASTSGIKPDLTCAALVVEAALVLGGDADKETAAAVLERMRKSLRTERQYEQLDDLLGRLR